MLRIPAKVCLCFVLIGWCSVCGRLLAAPAADTLVPATTQAFFSIPQFPDANTRWDKTRLGQLIADPALDPFFEDLRRQVREKWFKNSSKLGTTWEDLEQAASGEVALAMIHIPRTQPAVAVIIDVTGRVDKAQQLLRKIAQDFVNQQARASRRQVAGATVDVFEFPPDEAGENPEFAYYTIVSNLVIGADELPALEAILRRLAAPAQDTLAKNPVYQAVLSRAAQGAKDNSPQARWFIEPIGLMAAIEIRQPPKTPTPTAAPQRPAATTSRVPQRTGVAPAPAAKPAHKKTQSEVARELGFGAIQGLGGLIFMPADRYDFLSYSAVYAPKPWQKSMNMLVFPNGNALGVEPWVPGDVATHIAFNIDIVQAEANFEPLFDQLFGEGEKGVWTDVKESLRDDPNGPKVDLVKDLVNNLGQRATFITDYLMPITPTSERTCLAVVATNANALAEAVKKSMATDPKVRHRQFEGFDIWEMEDEEVSEPDVEIEDPNRQQTDRPKTTATPRAPVAAKVPANQDAEGEGEGMGPEGQRLLPKSAVTVARGYLFIASHVDFLEKILQQKPETSLSASGDYQATIKEMQALSAGAVSFEVFVRQGPAVRPTFELVRQNKLPEAQTMLAKVINRILTRQGETGRAAEIDGNKLPPFEQVQRYFGVGGMFVTTEPDGWFLVGFSPKEVQPQVGALPAATKQQ